MDLEYYYNITPHAGKVRNNLIYTSLISKDKKVFVKWYHNDTDYHKGKNQVVDLELMDIKWDREKKFLTMMNETYPDLVPKILDINDSEKKIYLEIDGVDFWQKSLDQQCSFDEVLPDWRNQMLNIFQAHKNLGLWKYSLHPSSYFIVGEKLKSINYFFTYHTGEPAVTLEEHRSHISEHRQEELQDKMIKIGVDWNTKVPFDKLQLLCLESFRSDYPKDFIERSKQLYVK
jgi:hypothetical protein